MSNPEPAFVYRIGPLAVAGAPGYWYQVVPPTDDVFYGADDTEMLAAIKAAVPDRSLECEPALASAGVPLGYAVRELTPLEQNARARLWVTFEAEEWFTAITEQVAFALFLEFGTQLYRRGDMGAAVVELEVELRGSVYGETFDETLGVVWTGDRGFFAFADPPTMSRFQQLTIDGELAEANELPRWALQYALGSEGLQEAMRAAFEVPVVPFACFDGPDGRRAVNLHEAWRVGLCARAIEAWMRTGAATAAVPVQLAHGGDVRIAVRFVRALVDTADGKLTTIDWDQLAKRLT